MGKVAPLLDQVSKPCPLVSTLSKLACKVLYPRFSQVDFVMSGYTSSRLLVSLNWPRVVQVIKEEDLCRGRLKHHTMAITTTILETSFFNSGQAMGSSCI
ncbi:hypothetical protein GOP47_0008967 [Adiantum capillus-veneris]|uniref:Uncharacterized protein n=1 Tax=Adiantum capillus-veneris TaxID=13818 RepID=A0A9D4V0T7_ADICA|nr:hypothetical protein GOP47_0008967 [Adiantum capillus-veneris]